MICPIISQGRSSYADCVKEKCAWYNKYKEECCIKVLSEKIEDVAEGQRSIYIKEI